jgi:hypothetical protein
MNVAIGWFFSPTGGDAVSLYMRFYIFPVCGIVFAV